MPVSVDFDMEIDVVIDEAFTPENE